MANLIKISGGSNASIQGKALFNAASTPTYNIGRSLSAVNEGSSVTFTLSTTNVSNGTVLPYTISGISANDVTTGSLTGSFTVNSGLATTTITMSADQLTEGAETATLTLNNAAASNFVVVNDTSIFTPDTISGLQLWLDASDSSTLYNATVGGSLVTTDGAAVARWQDKSGNGRHATQATANARPLLKTGIKNGRNVLRFDGSNDWLQSNFTTVSQYSMFVVYKRTGSNTNIYNNFTFVFGVGKSGDAALASRLTQLRYTSSPDSFGWSARVFTDLSIPRNDNFNIHSCVAPLGTGTARYLLNGSNEQTVNVSALNGTTNTPLVATIGVETWSKTFLMNGDICEILFYNSALTTTQRQQVETYLNTKWALY